MSAVKEPQDWFGEDKHWEDTKFTRDQEDVKLRYEYGTRQDHLRHRLVDLYDRRSHLQNEIQAVQAGIQFQEAEQERLAREFEDNTARLRAQREKEDKSHREWFARSREREHQERERERDRERVLPSKENIGLKSNGRRSSRELPLPNPTPMAGWTSINGSRQRNRRDDEDELPADPGNLLSSIYHNPINESDSPNGRLMPVRNSAYRSRPDGFANSATPEVDLAAADSNAANRAKDRPLKPKQRHSLPSFSAVVRSPTGRPPLPELPLETKTKSPSSRKSLPAAKGSVPPTDSPALEVGVDQEITRQNLIFKDDGSVITEPPMFAGIPLERIDEKHPYWSPEWESLEGLIQPQLDKWKEKLESLRRTPEAVRHTVFLANRQVNRGQAVIDFLKNENFHPYQYVGKDMMAKFYKTFVNYDTMFRLANVHEELKKFDLDVTPVQWLRQRMYEISIAQGDKFSLSKTTHDLYHDAKLKFLREKHGFGNIGRPSGYKVGEKDPSKAAGKTKAKRESGGTGGTVRRKGRRSIGQVDPDESPNVNMEELQQSMQQGLPPGYPAQAPTPDYLEPVTPRQQKRQRLEPTPQPQEPEDELEFEGYTSTDSFSAGRIMHLDWRVYQIKTRTLTTSTEVTQYWTWKQDKNLFEHQVLRDVHPKVTWGFYQKPINFDLALDEVKEIQYSPDSQKILAVIADEKRGNVLAFFKRERTKKRFLHFAKKKGMKLMKTTATQLEDTWTTMESETIPDDEAER